MPTRRERLREQETRKKEEEQRRTLLMIGAGIAAVAAVLALIFFSGVLNTPATGPTANAANEGCTPVQSFPSQGQAHIQPNQTHPPYSSNPPTSGWHWDEARGAGIFTAPQVQEQLVHDLEHGFIVIQYNNLPAADVQRLATLVQRDRYHTILAPYSGLAESVRVALTAWTKLQTCTGVDEKAIAAFVNAYRDQGPEKVP
jgi:hypothetical protein